MKSVKIASGLLLLSLLANRAGEAEIALPPMAISEKTNYVVWLDVRQLAPGTLEKTHKAIDAIYGPESPQADKIWQAAEQLAQTLVDAGGELLVITSETQSMIASSQEVPAGEAASKPANDAGILMVRLKEGVTAQQFGDKVGPAIKNFAAQIGVADDPEARAALEALRFVPAANRWLYVEAPKSSKPYAGTEQSAKMMRDFAAALDQQPDSPVRLALRMTDQMRAQLAEQAVQPSLFDGAVFDRLRAAQFITLGMTPGDNARADLRLLFTDRADAAAFKESLDKLIMGIGRLMMFASRLAAQSGTTLPGPGGTELPTDEAVTAVLARFLMVQQGSALSTSVDLATLKRIKELNQSAVTQPAATQPEK